MIPGKVNYNAIKSLPAAESVKDMLPVICERIAAEFKGLRKIYLYGSQARGDWNEDSDTDLLVIIHPALEQSSRRTFTSRLSAVICDVELTHPSQVYKYKFVPIWIDKDLDEAIAPDVNINKALIHNIKREGVAVYESTTHSL